MRRFIRSLATVALAGLSVLLVAAPASAYCCKCAPKSGTSAICLTDVSGTCSDILSRNSGSNPDLTNISACESLPDTKCISIAGGESTSAVCQQGPTPAKSYSAQVVAPKQIGTINAPQLNVPIPGLQFADDIPMYAGQKASVPFLAQYINAIYNYLLGIVVITAAVMIVYGGFKYIVSSSMEGVKGGKDIITDAIIGLVLVFGSYTILAVINPATTSLKPLLVETIKTTAWDDFSQAQISSKADTQDSPGMEIAPGAGCPFTLTNPLTQIKQDGKMLSYQPIASDARSQEFISKAKAIATGTTVSERIQQVGNAAAQCGVHLGFCGQVAGTIYAIAGVADNPKCLEPAPDQKSGYAWPICHPQDNPKTAKTLLFLPNATMVKLRELRCDHEDCKAGVKVPNADYCVSTQSDALDKARDMIAQAAGSGYPDSWTSQLQPGDFFQVYNGNISCGSGHSILFLGWGEGGNARVVTGQWGENVSFGTQCIKKGSCNGGKYLPIVRVFRPIAQ